MSPAKTIMHAIKIALGGRVRFELHLKDGTRHRISSYGDISFAGNGSFVTVRGRNGIPHRVRLNEIESFEPRKGRLKE